MNKIIASLIIISPFVVLGAPKITSAPLSEKDRASFSAMISTFDIHTQDEALKIDIRNVSGHSKSDPLMTMTEEYEEYSKYSLDNPHQKNHKLDLFIFYKVKPVLLDDRDLTNSTDDISDLRFDLQVLLDSASKKTIKSKMVVYYKDIVIAEGSVDDNSEIKIKDDLSKLIRNCKILELKVTRNILGTHKRALDLEVKYVLSGRPLKQALSISLENVKQTPIMLIDEENENEEYEIEEIKEEIENETVTTHS